VSKLQQLRRERIIIPKRKRLTKVEKFDLDKRDGHACIECGIDRDLQQEHLIARTIKPDDTITNVRWMCAACHAPKTTIDRKIIAKCQRLEKKDRGEVTKKRKSIPSPGFRKDGPKQKFPKRGFQKRVK